MNVKKYMRVWMFVFVAVLLSQITAFAHRSGFDEKTWTLSTALTYDGAIGATEWCDASKITVPSQSLTSPAAMTVQLKQDGTNLYVEMSRVGLNNPNNQVFIYFDTNHDGTLNASDKATLLTLSNSGINSIANYCGNGTTWYTSGGTPPCTPPTWTASSSTPTTANAVRTVNAGTIEMMFPLDNSANGINLPAGGSIGFGIMSCDRQSAREWMGWPTYNLPGQGSCGWVPATTPPGDSGNPSLWGTITRPSSTEYYPGVCDTRTAWSLFDSYWWGYTFRGQPILDWETSHDPSHGPAAVQPDNIDIASNTNTATPGGSTSIEVAIYPGAIANTPTVPSNPVVDCNNRQDDVIAFRFWLDGDPVHSSSDGTFSRNWNVLLDTDGDGYKEYWIDLAGWFSGSSGDVIYLYYDNSNSQEIPKGTQPIYSFPVDTIEQTATTWGSAASFVRITEVTRSPDGNLDYQVDIQVPYKYLDAANEIPVQTSSPDCDLNTVRAFYSTSASNTNPLQKDWMGDFCGQAETFTTDQPLCFGDAFEMNPGTFRVSPMAYDITVPRGSQVTYAHRIENLDTAVGGRTYSIQVTGITGDAACNSDSKTVNIYLDQILDTDGNSTINYLDRGNGVIDSGDTLCATALASAIIDPTTPLTAGAPCSTTNVASKGTLSPFAVSSMYFLVEVVPSGNSPETCTANVSVQQVGGATKSGITDKYTVQGDAVKINEVMYHDDPTTGYEWVELTNTSPYYTMNVDGWVITDNDGNDYTLSASTLGVPSLTMSPSPLCGPDEARMIIVFGGPANTTSGNACLRTIYTGNAATDWFASGSDDVSLCAGACSGTTIVDYVAYGASPGTGDINAVLAGMWTDNTYAAGVPTGDSLSRFRKSDFTDAYDTNAYTDWYAANAPSPGEENTPNIVINEVELDGTTVNWAELYVQEDGIAGAFGVDIRGYALTDLDTAAEAFATTPVFVFSGEYIKVTFNSAAADETDTTCTVGLACGANKYRDLYISATGPIPTANADEQLALAINTTGGQYIDALVWDAGDNTWGVADDGTDVVALNGQTVNGIAVPMWNSANATDAISRETMTINATYETIGRDALSTDTNAYTDWADSGGKDATDNTDGARNVGLIINEVMFDPSSGNDWVELYCGAAITNGNYRLEFTGGSYDLTVAQSRAVTCGANQYIRIELPSLNLAANDYIRLCDVSVTATCYANNASDTNLKDFIAYGANALANDNMAVTANMWTDGDFVATAGISQGETIGRDMYQADTNRSLDWETHGGKNAIGPTPTDQVSGTASNVGQNVGQQLIFNEVMYNNSSGKYDWIEIYNPMNYAQSFVGYTLSNGTTSYSFNTTNIPNIDTNLEQIPPYGYLVIYLDEGGNAGSNDYEWSDGDAAELHINFQSGTADNLAGTETLRLLNPSSTEVDNVNLTWVTASTVPADMSIGRDKFSTDTNGSVDWAAHGGADAIGITMGAQNIGSVIINEVSFNSTTSDWIELYNPTDTALDIDDYCVSLNGTSCAYTIPDIQQIPAGGYLIIHFGSGTNNDVNWSDGDAAVLYTGGTGLDTSEAIGIYNSASTLTGATIVDFVAYSYSPTAAYTEPGASAQDAVDVGGWPATTGATSYIALTAIASNETIGRNRNSTDSNIVGDWANTGGADATAATYAAANFTNPFFPPPPEGPTYAVIGDFRAYVENGKVIVEWQTSVENGTLGFYLQRQEPTTTEFLTVHEDLLLSSFSPVGGTYRCSDPQAKPWGTYVYQLVEVEDSGATRIYGPYQVTLDRIQVSPFHKQTDAIYSSQARRPSMEEMTRTADASFAQASNEKVKRSRLGATVKIGIMEEGLHYLDASQLAHAMGVSPDAVKQFIRAKTLSVRHQGQMVAWLAEENANGVYFYAERLASRYADENIYWVNLDKGQRMDVVNQKQSPSGFAAEVFSETVHLEKSYWPLPGISNDPEVDFWFWDYVTAGNSTLQKKTFPFVLTGVANTAIPVRLTIRLFGASNTSAALDHHVIIAVNGVSIGEGRWDGKMLWEQTMTFSQAILKEGENQITVSGVLDQGVKSSIFFIDSFDLIYQRYYQAAEDTLMVKSDRSDEMISIDGFTTSDILLLDITTPLQPIEMRVSDPVKTLAGYKIMFTSKTAESRYIALTRNAAKNPLSMIADVPSNLRHPANEADYLVIAPMHLQDAARELAAYRQSFGLQTMVVDLEDIYDEFNFGIVSPLAIRDFLSYTSCKWNIPPRYVVLAGEGNYDYKNYQGKGDNLIPPLLTGTPYGVFASDTMLADFVGNDGVSDVAIGRIPVLTPEELLGYVEKIKRYEATLTDVWKQHVLMTADNPDENGNFPANSDAVATVLPPNYQMTKIYLSQLTIKEARQRLFKALSDGVSILNYVGHGGSERFAAEGLLTSADINILSNGDRLPVITAMTCAVGRFSVPGFDSLAELLVLKPNGGAVAVWSPDGISLSEQALILDQAFFQAAFVKGKRVLGDIILDALQTYGAQGGMPFMMGIYNLLGDPALRPWGGAYEPPAARPAMSCEQWQEEPGSTPPQQFITIQKAGDGNGTIFAGIQECGPACTSLTVPYVAQGNVFLEAIPDAGSYFAGWQNLQGKTSQDVHFAPPQDVVIAIFKKRP